MLQFRPTTQNDIKTWQRFQSELYADFDLQQSEQEIKFILDSPDFSSFFILKNNEPDPIGLIELSLRNIVDGCGSSPVAYIEGLYLIEKHRGQGLGKELLKFTKKWAKENDCTELAVDTELDNKRAQQFYLREGFAETSRIVQLKMDL